MYPFVRMGKEILKTRRRPRLGLFEPHISRHVCWPWDLDPWWELNNGRTLTLFDLGRIPFGTRIGLHDVCRANGWRMTVAGNSVRYRQRVRPFDRLEMVTRLLGWDARFFYAEQSLWRDGACTSHILVRSAVIDASGIIAPARVAVELSAPETGPELPQWVRDWIAADAGRPWPPSREGVDPQ